MVETLRGEQGPWCRPSLAKEGFIYAGHGGRCMHAAWGADTSGGGWRLAGVGEVQLENLTQG